MSNLLVIDFDYFFFNPLYAVRHEDERFWLFDWGHSESSLYTEWVWPIRASSFLQKGFDLPQVDVPNAWWDRFNIAPDAICEVSDSNMYSGCIGRDYKHVWLYDAHHDLYRIKTEEDLEKFKDKGEVTCEDWMFVHHVLGSKLHWRWPRWFTYGKHMRHEVPKWVNLDARKDDMGKLDMRFDAVSICRSGAWVPPWCDEDFKTFYESCPVSEINQVDDMDLVRPWDIEQVRQMAIEERDRLVDEFHAKLEEIREKIEVVVDECDRIRMTEALDAAEGVELPVGFGRD